MEPFARLNAGQSYILDVDTSDESCKTDAASDDSDVLLVAGGVTPELKHGPRDEAGVSSHSEPESESVDCFERDLDDSEPVHAADIDPALLERDSGTSSRSEPEPESVNPCERDLDTSEPAPAADIDSADSSTASDEGVSDVVWEELRRARLRFIHAARRIGWFHAPPVPRATSSGSDADSAADTGPAEACDHGSGSDLGESEADAGSSSSESSSHWDEFEASSAYFIECAQRAGWYDLVRYRHLLGPRPDMVVDRDVLEEVSPRSEAPDWTVQVSRSASSGHGL